MNNFPAMTEAQRQELIKRLVHFRKGIQAARDANMQTEADDNDDFIAQIALAALAAEPVGWMVKYGGIDKEFFVDKQAAARLYHDVTENGFLDVAMLQLYTAPPAPVLRLPGEVKRSDAPCHLEAYEADCWVDGASYMREEAQRLNTQAAPTESSNEQ